MITHGGVRLKIIASKVGNGSLSDWDAEQLVHKQYFTWRQVYSILIQFCHWHAKLIIENLKWILWKCDTMEVKMEVLEIVVCWICLGRRYSWSVIIKAAANPSKCRRMDQMNANVL